MEQVLTEEVVAILRKKTHMERVALAGSAWNAARLLVADRIRAEHSTWTEEQIAREVTQRFLQGDLPIRSKLVIVGPDELSMQVTLTD